MSHKEADFEVAIVRSLLEDGGYVEGDPSTFNAVLGLFERDLIEFVQTTQPEAWGGLVKLYGASAIEPCRHGRHPGGSRDRASS